MLSASEQTKWLAKAYNFNLNMSGFYVQPTCY